MSTHHGISEISRQRLVDMAWQLNELVMDLKTPTDVMILLKGEAKNGMQIMSLSRMILSALFVNLRKITEIIDHYGSDLRLLPTDVRNDLIKIKKAIDDKGIYKYRSTYIAHAFTQEKGRPKRPLTVAEASKALAIIIDEGLNSIIENVLSFCNWIYKKDDPNCVVNILYRTVQAVESIVGGLGARP